MWTPRGADWTVLDQNATSCLAKKKNTVLDWSLNLNTSIFLSILH